MAKFQTELPNDLIKQIEDLDKKSEKIFGEMVEEGGKIVYKLIKSNMARAFKTTKSLDKGLKITKVYKTKSDDGINVHVGFYGYNDKGVPIPLIAMAREYGTPKGEKKKPFLRKSFKKKEIEQAMMRVQDKYIKGD
jgi:hypothetical protein